MSTSGFKGSREDKHEEEPTLRMHPEDAKNFPKLAEALKVTFGHTVQVADHARAKTLLIEYLEGYQRVSSLSLTAHSS